MDGTRSMTLVTRLPTADRAARIPIGTEYHITSSPGLRVDLSFEATADDEDKDGGAPALLPGLNFAHDDGIGLVRHEISEALIGPHAVQSGNR